MNEQNNKEIWYEERFIQRLNELNNPTDTSFSTNLGLRFVSCDVNSQEAVFQIQTLPWMENSSGFLHGGVAASILDLSMGIACSVWSGSEISPTIHLGINYLKPVRINREYFIRTKILHLGIHNCSAEGAVIRSEGEQFPLVQAEGVYYRSYRNERSH